MMLACMPSQQRARTRFYILRARGCGSTGLLTYPVLDQSKKTGASDCQLIPARLRCDSTENAEGKAAYG